MSRMRALILVSIVAATFLSWVYFDAARLNETASVPSPSAGTPSQALDESVAGELPRREGSKLPAEISIPAHYALLPGMTVPAADSWEALVSMLLPDERALVESLRSRYPEAYQFKSINQLKWMVEHGYPMPTEIVAASRIPLRDLKQMAADGNVKAAMLARERLLMEALANSEQLGSPFHDSPLMKEIGFMDAVVRDRNCSPFSFYISARRYEELARARLDDSALGALAAHAVIASLGDPRSQDYAERLAGAFPFSGRSAMELAQMSVLERRLAPPNCRTSRFPLN